MEKSWLMRPVKYSDSAPSETFIEHAIRTFHVGKYLYEQIKPKFEQKEFLYGCFFHDAGKLASKPGEPHTPRTKEGLASIVKTGEYKAIIKAFDLEDMSQNERIIRAIEEHHDSVDEISAYISIADQIASSENDENLKNRLKSFPISTLITYLNEMHGFSEKHFYHVRFYSFSKNELNAVGRLFLLKLLYETIEQLPDVRLLYETLDGCRVVTELDPSNLKKKLSAAFNKNLVTFIENQNLEGILGGAPDNYSQFTNLPREIKPRLVELTVKKYRDDIVDLLKKKKIERIEDVGLSDEILSNLVKLEEVYTLASQGIKGISKTKYYLFADEHGLFPKWIAETFFKENRKAKMEKKIIDNGTPLIEKFLSKAGADVSKITCKEEVYNKLFPLIVAVNSLERSTVDFCFDVEDYLAVDDEVSLGKIAKKNSCANCGVFEGEVELTPFVFEYKQHAKETLFKETEDEFRSRESVICGLCQIEAIFNTLLCGTKLEGMQARVDTRTHLIICGLGISEDLLEDLANPEGPIKRLIKRFKITNKSVYIKKKDDFQFLVMSLKNTEAGSENIVIQKLLFSLLATRLKQNHLILALGVNKVPTNIDDSVVQFDDGEIAIIDDVRTDFFEYVYFDSNLPFRQERDVVLQYVEKPFIGVAQIFKKGNLKYSDNTEELVQKMSKDDELFSITDQIWEMAKIGGSLETRKNVGSFLVGFNGTPKSIDLIANKLLKNTLLSAEKRGQVIEIHEKLRHILEKLDEAKRKLLKDYVQKTKYFFNSKKFYEVRKKGESVENESTQ
jgi:hypothetical protein